MAVGTPSPPSDSSTTATPRHSADPSISTTSAAPVQPAAVVRNEAAKPVAESAAALDQKRQLETQRLKKIEDDDFFQQYGYKRHGEEDIDSLDSGDSKSADFKGYLARRGRAQKSPRQMLEEARRREARLKEEAEKKLHAQQSNDPSAGHLSKLTKEEARLAKIEEWKRLAKEGSVFERVKANIHLVTTRPTWAVQGFVDKTTRAIVSPVTNLFKSGADTAKGAELAKDGAHGAELARDGIKAAEIARDGIKGLKVVKMIARGSQVFAAATAWTGLGGVAGVAIDATLGLVAGGLVYAATGNAKAAALEAVDTASPVPVKALLDVGKAGMSLSKGDGKGALGHLKNGGANAISWTGLGIFTPINNVVHRLEQGKEIADHRKGIEETAKGAVKGVEEIVKHPVQDLKALNYAEHHMGETAKLIGATVAAIGGTVATVAAVKHAEHKGLLDKHTAYDVTAKGYAEVKTKIHQGADEHHDRLQALKGKADVEAKKLIDKVKQPNAMDKLIHKSRAGMKALVPEPNPSSKSLVDEAERKLHALKDTL